MTSDQTKGVSLRQPLRLWPGVLAAVLLLLLRFIVPMAVPGSGGTAILSGLVGGLAITVWWLFFSRMPWSDRVGAIVVMVAAVLATSRVVHVSIASGMMGMMLPIVSFPVLSLTLVASAAASRRLSDGPRRAAMAAAILLASGAFTLLRTGGITGDGVSDLHWRWTTTPEERLLAQSGATLSTPSSTRSSTPATAPSANQLPDQDRRDVPAATPADTPERRLVAPAGVELGSIPTAPPATVTAADWPGFRGPERDDVVRGVRIKTDWAASPPIELWRRPIGPGWSSFAVLGDLLYTQEQRGDDEIVTSYNLTTGKPVWMHRDATRFWESNGGAGPRATPTISNGRLYTFGATGILNALDAGNGAVIWSRNAASDTGSKIPDWGFASSPLVVGDEVVVHTGVLIAYDRATGNRRWVGPARDGGYSSPHLLKIDGVAQILQVSGAGATSVAPTDGALLWEHSWPGTPIVQPAQVAEGALLISTADAMGASGTRLIAVAHGPGGWAVEERWTSNGLKPYFNDFVVHKGHAYGFDGSILASIGLEDGKRKWKGGRYGNGQLVLLTDQDLLMVLSEDGELALVKATPDQFTELARFPALEGKTWNHPVLVGDVLLVRNGEEMAAFRLSLADR
ncbi:MAG: PQQ-binding-like beta-propeller repeat protein [Acidobacteriota bacterium]